ncbi:MAG: putative porin [Bacteroidetes bacterium]|nr:putative porin [Bacteroidota bacterium]
MKLFFRIFLFSGYFLLFQHQIFALPTDSVKVKVKKDTMNVRFFYQAELENNRTLSYHKIDTILKGFQKYSALKEHLMFPATFGNSGFAYTNRFYNPDYAVGFEWGIHAFDDYRFTPEKVKYYRVNSPYSELYYVQGAKREQIFEVIHSQNINRNWNIGVDYRLNFSLGSYNRQKANHSAVVLFTDYSTKNHKYRILANFIHNRIMAQENGGIQNPEDFESNIHSSSSRNQIPVNLSAAENRINETSLYFKQFYHFGSTKRDNPADSTSKKHFYELFYLSHSFKFQKLSQIFYDGSPTDGYFSNVFIDTLATNDSIHLLKFENDISLSSPDKKSNGDNYFFKFGAGMKYSYIENYTDTVENFINQYVPHINFSTDTDLPIYLNANASYVLGDYNDGDVFAEGNLTYKLKIDSSKIHQFRFKAIYINQQPDYLKSHYYGNNFIWNNDFKKINVIKLGLTYSFKNLEVGLNSYQIDNFVIYNKHATPVQLSPRINIFTAYIFKDFKFWKLGLDNKIAYQYEHGSNIINLPMIVGNQSLYFNQDFFHKALYTQFGFEVNYNTSYYADGYMPATRVFYSQDEKKLGDYIFADFFVNLKIKRANLFLKYQHFNAGLGGYQYYTVPGYPMQDRTIKFGVSWKFYD